ncbi:hypothetical protein MRX96_056838 [Rhipicephalus microplus]
MTRSEKADGTTEDQESHRNETSAEGRAPTYDASSIVYPEVFVAVDSSYGGGASNEQLLRYLIIFLAGDRSLKRVTYYHIDADLTLQQFHLQLSRYQFGNPDIFLLLTGLGAPHDVYPQPYHQTCGWELGYIMSYHDGGLRKHYFSPCSENLIRQSLSSKLPSCLALNFVHDYLTQVPGVYPGNEFNGNLFCKAMHRHIPTIYFPEQLPNILLRCRVTCNEPQGFNGAYKFYTHHALEGTPCHSQNHRAVRI